MLVHYFGTKEALISEVLAATRPDIPEQLAEHEEKGHSPEEIAQRLWWRLAGGPEEAHVRILLETMALALTQPKPYGPHATAAVQDWVGPLADALHGTGMDRREARARATLLVSGLRGVALDRYLTGDRQRTDDAARVLIATAIAVPPPPLPAPHSPRRP